MRVFCRLASGIAVRRRQLRHPRRMSRITAEPAKPAAAAAPAAGSVMRSVDRRRNVGLRLLAGHVSVVDPVAFVYINEPIAVMMATPADLAEFAIGFARSEGIVPAAPEVSIDRIEEVIEGIE